MDFRSALANKITSQSSYSLSTTLEPQHKPPLTQRPFSHWDQVSTTIPAYRTLPSLGPPALETTASHVSMATTASNILSAY